MKDIPGRLNLRGVAVYGVDRSPDLPSLGSYRVYALFLGLYDGFGDAGLLAPSVLSVSFKRP